MLKNIEFYDRKIVAGKKILHCATNFNAAYS